jgi:hypothetical protein
VAELGGGYAKVRAELGRLVDQLPPAGREAVLGGTATRFYQLGPGRGHRPGRTIIAATHSHQR